MRIRRAKHELLLNPVKLVKPRIRTKDVGAAFALLKGKRTPDVVFAATRFNGAAGADWGQHQLTWTGIMKEHMRLDRYERRASSRFREALRDFCLRGLRPPQTRPLQAEALGAIRLLWRAGWQNELLTVQVRDC
jgi:hypothetical protein